MTMIVIRETFVAADIVFLARNTHTHTHTRTHARTLIHTHPNIQAWTYLSSCKGNCQVLCEVLSVPKDFETQRKQHQNCLITTIISLNEQRKVHKALPRIHVDVHTL